MNCKFVFFITRRGDRVNKGGKPCFDRLPVFCKVRVEGVAVREAGREVRVERQAGASTWIR